MADQTTEKATQDRDRLRWLLWVASLALLYVMIGTWSFRQLPWLTALSALIIVSLCIAGVTRLFNLSPQQRWRVLLVLALGLYFGSLSYQAGDPAGDTRHLAWATSQLPNSPGNLILAIAYPRTVPLETSDKSGRPLSVYLWPPVLPATPIVTSIAQMLTPTQAVFYTVAFLPYDDGLLFTDEKGVPVAPQVVVEPGQSPDKPAVLYVRRAPLDTVPVSVPITVQVYGPGGNPQDLTTLEVRPEDAYGAWWRHFWALVLGPTTPLLALAATLVGFGWQWQQEEQKRKWEVEWERRRERRERLAEIEQVRALVLQSKLQEAIQKLLEVSHKVERVWEKDNELVARLAEVRKYLETQPWRQNLYQESLQMLSKEELDKVEQMTRLLRELDPDFSAATDLHHVVVMLRAFRGTRDRWPCEVEELGVEFAVDTLVRVSRESSPDVHLVLAELLADLAGRPEYVEVICEKLMKDWIGLRLLEQAPFEKRLGPLASDRSTPKQARMAAEKLLRRRQRPFVWPDLWPGEQRPLEPPSFNEWLNEIGLAFNPFGPEQAEEDPLLTHLLVKPLGWELMKALEPTVVFGADGSGRTASRLLLAHTCTTTGLGLDCIGGQLDTFPVRLTLFPEGQPDQAVVAWLTRALAQATLNFLALNPQTFAETPFRQQRALARLFAMHCHYLGDLAGYLAGVGLDDTVASRVSKEIKQAGRGTRPPTPEDEQETLTVLAEARLHPFQRYYLLAELHDDVLRFFAPEEVAAQFEPLLKRARYLALADIYLKIWLPDSLRPHLEGVSLKQVSLEWTADKLRDLLTTRFKAAGVDSLAVICRRVRNPEARLVESAKGLPGQLIRLGNELLRRRVRRGWDPKDPRLTEEDFAPPNEVFL